MNGHAKKGGEIGINGAFYEGGQFLPSTTNEKGTSSRRGDRKIEIEPYVWVEYSGKLAEGEVVDGFYRFFSSDYKTIYGNDYASFILPYKKAWDEGKRFRIFERTSHGMRLLRFE